MPLVDLKVKHGRTMSEAQGLLEKAADETKARFGLLIQRVNWSEGRNAVVQGGFPFLGNLIGSPMVTGLKSIVQQVFRTDNANQTLDLS